MNTFSFQRLVLLALACAAWVMPCHALTPPTIRSTDYNGSYSNIVYYSFQPWMNTNTTVLTVEAWIYCRHLNGNQAIVARHYTTNLYFGLSGNKLRFYRSGGTFADSDGTVAARRWTHVAATYDGATARFYINGVAAGTKGLANAGNNCTNSLSLGGQHDLLNFGDILAGGFAFNGYLDEVRLWTVVRSQSQLTASMYEEVRSGTGLLATFGSGGSVNELLWSGGSTDGIAGSLRRSGFGILPTTLRIPFSSGALRADGVVDMFNEYRGAETIVLRSTLNNTTPDQRGYLMVSTNSTNFHLYVAVPDIQQSGFLPPPTMQVAGNVNLTDGTNTAVGDWECRLAQDSFQGGTIFGVNPPFFPTPQWLSWGQSTQNWQAATTSPNEFHQDYEFRIHGRHLNYFTNSVGLLVRYYGFNGAEQLVAPRGGVTNQPSTYATAEWGGVANANLINVSISGEVNNVTTGGNQSGWTVTLRSGASAFGGVVIRTIPVAADGTFTITGEVPRELPIHLTLEARSGYTILPPEYYGSLSGQEPSSVTANSTLSYAPCPFGLCTYRNVRFRVQSPPGPLALTSVAPLSVPATVLVRTTPRKTTPVANLTLTGANLHSGIRVFFKGSGCVLDPPSFCTSDWIQAEVVSTAFDRTSATVAVPELPGTGVLARNFQIVVENPLYLSTGGNRWTYGSTVSVTPPIYAGLYGFEFRNGDDGPSLEEFEANFGDNIFVDLPFTDIAVPGLRDPYYYTFFFPVYMAWMELAKGSCTGFAATSRLMANGAIPFAAFDRADNGEGVRGVLYPNGYVGLPPCNANAPSMLCAPKPAAWTGFDVFQPFRPIDVWGRIISLQGAQTSAEFLNTWLPQLKRPILTGPRRGISVGDPNLVLSRIRTSAQENLIILGGREFQVLHTVTPYGVIEEQGLLDDLLTPTPRAGFSLIKIYDNNWPESERYIEVNRTENTFRYLFFNSDSGPVIGEGAGLYYMPVSVFRNPRHALGPADIAANLDNYIRVLHTGTASTSLKDASGGEAGWSGPSLVNSYEGALPFIPPGALPGVPDRFDTTMFFLPATNPPASSDFVADGGNVVLHYAMGEGDIAVGFNAAGGTSGSVYGILIGLNQALQGIGVRSSKAVQGFSASVSSRDISRRSLIWQLDAGAGAMTPDVHMERDGFNALRIRNNSPQPFSYRVNLAGYEVQPGAGLVEFASDLMNHPGNSTVMLKPVFGPARGFVRELDTNNDGTPDAVETLPARGALRASKDAGVLALRWRPLSANDTLESKKDLNDKTWSAVNAQIKAEGSDLATKVPVSEKHEFFRVASGKDDCFTLSTQPLGAKPNPWEIGGFKFEAFNAAGVMEPQNSIVTRSGSTGLDVLHTVRIHPLFDCDTVHIDLRQTSGLVILEAVGPLGAVIARRELIGAGAGVETVTLRGVATRIGYVRVTSPNALCVIVKVCGERTQRPQTAQPTSSCHSFSNETSGTLASPLIGRGPFILSSPAGELTFGSTGGLAGIGLNLFGEIQIDLLAPIEGSERVRLTLLDLEGVVIAKAFNSAGTKVAAAGPLPASSSPQELALVGHDISRIVLSSSSSKALLLNFCCDRFIAP
jgi:hypothetical protein